MNNLALYVVVLQTILYVVLGLAILSRNKKAYLNIAFSYFAFVLSLWTLFSFFGGNVNNLDLSAVLVRLDYATGTLLAWSFWSFSLAHRLNTTTLRLSNKLKMFRAISGIYGLAIGLVAVFSDYLLQISILDGSIVIRETSLFFPFYVLPMFIIVAYGVFNIYKAEKDAIETEKARARTITYSLVVPVVVIFASFVIFQQLNVDQEALRTLQDLSNLSIIIFMAGTTLAIVKHQLFDIRKFFAETIAYLLLFITFVVLYGAAIFVTARLLLGYETLALFDQVIYVALALLLAVTYQPLKDFFDRATNRIFFREAYNSQEILDELGSILATELSLQVIVSKSSEIILNSLKPSAIRFVVFKDGESYIDESSNMKRHRAVIRPEVDSFDGLLISRDDSDESVKEYLDLYDADILLKLRTNEETVGAILLGPKQSGTMYSKQDIDFLTISEKELAIAVQNSRYFEQIQEFNVKLQQEVEKATAQLRNSNEKLKALDEAKDEFVSMASHQLRTPLTSVKGYISMVLEEDAGKVKPEQRKLLEEAFASSQRMVYLIADLLNVSRLKTGKFIIEPSEVYLPDIVEQEVKQLLPTAKARQLKLTFNKPQRFPTVWLDETKIRQVIMNFVDNAIYYTKARGRIEVQLVAKRDRIEYKVKDNGIGVPKAEQSKLFTKFFRAGNARKARPDGTGLGLYMAQRVVSAQGGSVIFESEEGKGSVFGFSFPLKAVKTPPTKSDRPQSE